jgi:hypothetical protein
MLTFIDRPCHRWLAAGLDAHLNMPTIVFYISLFALLIGLLGYVVWRFSPRAAIASAVADAQGQFTLRFTAPTKRRTLLWVRYRWAGPTSELNDDDDDDDPPKVAIALDIKAVDGPEGHYRTAPKALWSGTLNATQGGTKVGGSTSIGPSGGRMSATKQLHEIDALPEGTVVACTGQFHVGALHYELLEIFAAPAPS